MSSGEESKDGEFDSGNEWHNILLLSTALLGLEARESGSSVRS